MATPSASRWKQLGKLNKTGAAQSPVLTNAAPGRTQYPLSRASQSLHRTSNENRGSVPSGQRFSQGNDKNDPRHSAGASSIALRQSRAGSMGSFRHSSLNQNMGSYQTRSSQNEIQHQYERGPGSVDQMQSNGEYPSQTPRIPPRSLNEHANRESTQSDRSALSANDQRLSLQQQPSFSQYNKKTSKEKRDSEDRRLLKQQKLQEALLGTDLQERTSEEEEEVEDPGTGRASGTVRRYSGVPREHRMSIKFKDLLASDRKFTPSTPSLKSVDVPTSSRSQGFFNSQMYHKARQSIAMSGNRPSMSHKSSLKNRRQEEHEMQEMTGSRQTRFLAAHTHFNEKEVESLQHMYHLFTQNEKPPCLFRLKFREIFQKHFGISGDAMLDQIFHYFDADRVGHISSTEFVRNLSTFLRGTFDEQTKFCFDIYDLKGEGAIGKNEVLTLLQDCLIPVPGVEAEMTDVTNIREIADLLIKKLDRDRTGHISLPDFRFAVRRDPTSLQCLGQCLPDPRDVKAFMALISMDYNDFKTNYSVPGMSSFAYERDRFNAPAMFPYKMMGAVKKAKTVVQIMQHLVSKGGKQALPTVAANNMRLAASNLLMGERHIQQSL